MPPAPGCFPLRRGCRPTWSRLGPRWPAGRQAGRRQRSEGGLTRATFWGKDSMSMSGVWAWLIARRRIGEVDPMPRRIRVLLEN